MSNNKIITLLIIFILSTSFSSFAWSSENYDDCFFKNLKSIGSALDGKSSEWYATGQIKSEENYKYGKEET